ncbi:MAG: UDP-3-O-acyl-N-acetylglucosamine deacetylase [Synechococcaceae bacterium WBA_2_066]|nr:UDP-3-O-acyl-N-acetylglucosamine deacetylase [Synechococcaceae bacterium WB6_1A_059]NBP98789.1 UDP-3-O-acyl-N-acetylglucosamine deacetylase [Synechococcaceae bacterium WB6_3A_227]NBQ19542.1 UDP-3-O-acyl-N-acetylglucosamine deacetylase [Synechococcaceae bacterium WB5_2A_257]NBR44342.1 UDP-3-O-acyl-N-acetylglucosamine deacetylase [Synechococcaceae bacterium WB5_2B_268]NBY60103.1 UDP-3-O-acyl-N-acetylglucosamine deacetylase [Synechococcaceae bacterium LLD_019]NCU90804.1 UDP-3-O-acyl-N-acetylgl
MQWPTNYNRCWGLRNAVERSGIGLHSGTNCNLRLQPGAAPGFRVGWLDRPNDPVQLLNPSLVQDTRLCTSLRLGDRHLATVEHLLAALAGTGITQAEIWLDAQEVPLLDGSALPWVEAIAEALPTDLGPRPPLPGLAEPITLQQGQGFVAALPSAELLLSAAIEFPQPAIGKQLFSIVLTPAAFVEQIAPARTFGFRDQVEMLLKAGLIKGGALDNALVCDGENWLNPPLRFVDEPVRHKLLDLIGDLALVGLPQAQVMAYRGSHALHTQLAAALHLKLTE